MARFNVMTAIPYVNGRPHVGHALELVQADVLARHRRQRGDEVRFQTGTDDNALKNVQSAEAAGVSPLAYVNQIAQRFSALRESLDLSFDDFIRTATDPRHRPAVEKLWALSAARDDFYRASYSGLYCVGCEQFYTRDELTADGRCAEHGTLPEQVEEDNWFFRLSRYQAQLAELIATDRLRVEPATRKREVLAFIEAGLEDFSVSRSTARARGWGIPVPGDPDQVIYVWYDALANYISAPGYANDPDSFDRWWNHAERVHVIGKGIIRFHAVYWPAILLSTGLALPDVIFVHEYLTADGAKISKSVSGAADPVELAERYGTDPLRWWFVREVARSGDTDFTVARMVARVNEDLANNIGNLVNRTVSMVNRYRAGRIPQARADGTAAAQLRAVRAEAGATIASSLDAFDFRRATEAVVRIGDEGNRYVEAVRPWELAKAARSDPAASVALDAVLGELVDTCRDLGRHLDPFLPQAAARIAAQCGDGGGTVPAAGPVFPRLEPPDSQ